MCEVRQGFSTVRPLAPLGPEASSSEEEPGLASGDTTLAEDRKLVYRLLSRVGRIPPVGGDITQRKPDQLVSDVGTGEMAMRLDDLGPSCIHALDGIGRVDHAARR